MRLCQAHSECRCVYVDDYVCVYVRECVCREQSEYLLVGRVDHSFHATLQFQSCIVLI